MKVGDKIYYQIIPNVMLEVEIAEIVIWWDTKELLVKENIDCVQSFETRDGVKLSYYDKKSCHMINISDRFEEIKASCKNVGENYWLTIPKSWKWGPYKQHCGLSFGIDNIYRTKEEAFQKIPWSSKLLKRIKQRFKIRTFKN